MTLSTRILWYIVMILLLTATWSLAMYRPDYPWGGWLIATVIGIVSTAIIECN